MKADISRASLPVFEALASEVRLNIIRLLAERGPMHNKEMAAALGLSGAIMTMHVGKLEKAGLIRSQMERKGGSTYKYCTLAVEHLSVEFPRVSQTEARSVYEHAIPVGHYTDIEAWPTCGLAAPDKMIGQYDDPRYFFEPERIQAHLIWFSRGYVEYKLPNYLLHGQQAEEIEVSFEIGSEAPGYNDQWPSDIAFTLNHTLLGQWTSPGDFGDTRGRLTPAWWTSDKNQYGLLKSLRINGEGTFIDGQQISSITIRDIELDRNQWTFRFEVPQAAAHVGGLTLYGRGFGNYDQDIVFRMYYKEGKQQQL